MASDRPVFVVGCARSGTTLLQLMLHAHPRIALPPETRFLIPAYQRRDRFGNLRKRRNRWRLARLIVDRRRSKFHDLGLDPAATKRAIVKAPPTIGSAAGVVFREYASRWGKQRWGDKRPAYILQLDVLYELFPDAQVIHIIRDGRDCVSSLKRMPWWEHGSIGAIWYWNEAMRRGERARRRLPPDSYYEVRYEDLVADPRTQLQRLCDFLGESFDEAMLAPHALAGEAVPERKLHHERTYREVDAAAVAQWHDQLERWELALMELVAGRRLRAHGYELSGQLRLPPPAKLAAYWRYARRRRLGALRRRRLEAERQARYGRPVAARLTRRQRRLARQERRRRRAGQRGHRQTVGGPA